MLLTLSTTSMPATDLGYLLHKNPTRVQTFNLAFGTARVFYPEADANRCTAALMLEVDPVGLVRNDRGPAGDNFALQQYVNDRPHAASSFLSVALSQVFGSALNGTSRDRPELAGTAIPLTARLSVLPCRGGEDFLRRLFEPLGYTITATSHPLDSRNDWGNGPYFTVELKQTIRLADLLAHLYVLVPVLDNEKHYWIGDDEVDKLLRHGQSWLTTHPEKDQIVRRYLKHQRRLANVALSRLVEHDVDAIEEEQAREAAVEEAVERPLSLNDHRHTAVVETLLAAGAKRVLDLGCNTGNLLRRLRREKQFEQIVGVDVSHHALEIAGERLHLDRLPEKQRARVQLLHGSLAYRDARLAGFDAAAVVEVIEHLDEPRLAAFERVIFEFARPRTVIVTTPNIEHNVRFETLAAGTLRHRDHRFEWTRQQFHAWADGIASRFGYAVSFTAIGPDDPEVGPPTQMATFTLDQPPR
ncbi:MAG TPA: 3' terminal RNA ribose 2'-O-methyltransferase Hen1 [Tepidisphaeraceae bacterium]